MSSPKSHPKTWVLRKLGEIASVTSGGTPDRKNPAYWNGNIPWVTTSLIDFNVITSAEECITKEGLEGSSAKLFKPGTLLMALYGQGVTRGKTSILGIEAATNQACAAIRVKEGNVDFHFLFHFLAHSYFSIRNLSNSGGQDNLSGELVKAIRIWVPPLEEQKAIALHISSIDNLIVKTEELISKTELRQKNLIRKMLTGGKRLSGFRESWKKVAFSEIIVPIERKFAWDDNERYKLVSVRRRSGGLFSREELFGHQVLAKDLSTIRENDFLISRRQITHGASSRVPKEFDGYKVSGSYLVINAKDPNILSMEFLDWFSKTPLFYHQTYVSSFGVHIEKLFFDFENFLTHRISLPNLAEQKAIVQVLQTAEREIQLLKAKAAKLREQKKGLMQVLLTGKKRIKAFRA